MFNNIRYKFKLKEHKRFNNIGDKLKLIANIYCSIGIGFWVLLGIVMIAGGIINYEYGYVPLGIAYIIIGTFLSWVTACFAYGFGQLIENTNKTEEDTEEEQQDNITISDLAAFLEDEEKRKAFEEFYKNNK